MAHRPLTLLSTACLLLLFTTPALNAKMVVYERFYLPLHERFGISSNTKLIPQQGKYELVQRRLGPRFSTEWLLPNVLQVGVSGPIIAGTFVPGTAVPGRTDAAFFLLDTRSPSPAPETFTTEQQWRSALASLAVPVPALADPATMASRLPEIQTHPWLFTKMRGTFGLSDDAWSGIVQLIGLALAFLLGMFARRTWAIALGSLIGGLLLNFVAQFVVTDISPSAFVGIFVMPLVVWVAASLGQAVGRRVFRQRQRT